MVSPAMGSFSVSLDETLTRKAEIMRDKKYPNFSVDNAVKAFLRESLDKFVPNKELEPKK